ncbi:hypothetical protein JCM24511_02964 [Saitozyma sp. JCM 24511]|nr:hypothetical protein JCM24511_02964 [Saitozyma sp. JCM 24511]
MPHSHHSHSGQFCRHAKDQLEEVVLEAIRQGFEVFGLSEHAPRYRVEDLFPEESDLSPRALAETYDSFLLVAADLRRKYAEQITLLLGLETDWITPLDSNGISRTLVSHPEIDYIVGSVHHVRGVSIDFDRDTWLRSVWQARQPTESSTMRPSSSSSNAPPTLIPLDPSVAEQQSGYTPSLTELRPFLLAYLDAQYDLLKTHQPEVIGHFDLCLLWTPGVVLRSDELEGVWDKVERNIRYAIGYGALFEANAAAIRKGWTTSYPSREILRCILDGGGRICLSDDSHGVSYVGLNYLRMRDYLVGEGVRDVWHLVRASDRREGDQVVGGRGSVVARRLSEWESHPFWPKLEAAQAGRRV